MTKLYPLIKSTGMLCLSLFLLPGEAMAQPLAITSFSPSSGHVRDTITITGTGFNPSPSNNMVFFGATSKFATESTPTSIKVAVPPGASYGNISILNTSTFQVATSSKVFTPTYYSKYDLTNDDFAAKFDLNIGSGNQPNAIAVGDLDGDGKPDIAVANFLSSKVAVYRNKSTTGMAFGGSFFETKVEFLVDMNPRDIAIADIDMDGRPEIITVNESGNSISILQNLSTIGSINAVSFAPRIDLLTGGKPLSVAVGDINRDGKNDIAVANSLTNSISLFDNMTIPGVINVSSFGPKVDYNIPSPVCVAVYDVDNDGRAEVIATSQSDNAVSVFRNNTVLGAPISMATLDIKLDFLTDNIPTQIAVGDLDKDGKNDIAVLCQSTGRVNVFRNGAAGTVNSTSFSKRFDFPVDINPSSLTIADIDGDSYPDLVSSSMIANSVGVYRNETKDSISSTSFFSKSIYITDNGPNEVVVCDMNADGKPDIMTANVGSNNVSLLRNSPHTVFVYTPGNASYHHSYPLLANAISAITTLGGDSIVLLNTVYNERNITVNKSLKIQGAPRDPGRIMSTIDAEKTGLAPVFQINAAGNLTIRDVKIMGADEDGLGGGINNKGSLHLGGNTIITGNQAFGGAGVYNEGSLTIRDNVSIQGNNAGMGSGGAIFNKGGTVNIFNGNFSDNIAPTGGAINNTSGGVVNLKNARIYNPAADGSRQNEIYFEAGTLNTDSCWWGQSKNVADLMVKTGSGAINLRSYIRAGWQINNGMPIQGRTGIFPLTSQMYLTTNGTDSLGVAPDMWTGRLSASHMTSAGAFAPSSVVMATGNTTSTMYTPGTTPALSDMLALIDADSFSFKALLPFTITGPSDTAICAGDSAMYYAADSLGNQWYLNDIPMPSATKKRVSAKVSGSFWVINSRYAPVISDTVVVDVHALPDVTGITGPDHICDQDTASLANATNGGTWVSTDTLIAKVSAIGHIRGISPGNTTITYSIKDNIGCVGTAEHDITIRPLPAPPSITPAGKYSICEKDTAMLSSDATEGNQWYFNGEAITNAGAKTYKAGNAGFYAVKAKGINGCISTLSTPLEVVVNKRPSAPVISGPTDAITGDTVLLNANSTSGNATNYIWQNGVFGNENKYMVTNSGPNRYWVYALSSEGCASDTTFGDINVNADPYWKINVGAYPNPFTDHIIITGIDLSDVQAIALYTLQGTLITKSASPATSLELQVPMQIPAGVYVVVVETKGSAKASRRVLKQ